MALGDRNKLNRLEELKGKLFSKNYQAKIEHRDSFSHLNRREVLDSWENKKRLNLAPEINFYENLHV